MAPAPSQPIQLPIEILTLIQLYLPNRDIKNLRLTCKVLLATSQLRVDRVFLSANPRNIEVFRAIAEHEGFREQVVEIIWDDARLYKETGPKRSNNRESPDFDPDFDGVDGIEDTDEEYYETDARNEDCPAWFYKGCQENLRMMRSHKGIDVDRPDHVARAERVARISLKRSWQYYQQLLRQQEQVLATDSDVDAFEYGLQRFPALRRVTVTPATHGWLFRPLYETPMIRAFPLSFNYPIPRSWPESKPVQKPWEDTPESEKDTWRGFRITTRALAGSDMTRQDRQAPRHGVTELIVDVNQLLTGLNAHIFDEDCTEQRHLVTVLQHPGFRRLDLTLAVGGLKQYGWRAFRSGCLRRTLAAAPDLEHVSLVTDMLERPDPWNNGQPEGDLNFVPLRDIFPISTWTRLRRFRLSHFAVRQGDLLSFLEALPRTLQSVELSFLFFLEGNYRNLVDDMRDQLGWRGRPAGQRPRVAIALPDRWGLENRPWRAIWADGPVEEFLYRDGPNPFTAGWSGNQIPPGQGGIVKDAFDPCFERPWVVNDELVRLGYAKPYSQR